LTTVAEKRVRGTRLVWPAIAGLVAITGSSAALAQETQLGGKIRSGGEVEVAAGETVSGDLYASGGQVRIEGTVDGDLVASGGQVQISGEVTGDALVGSGNVDISGQVGGDARLGAGQVTVGGSIGEDLVAGSGQATLSSSGQVGEDFIFGTGQATLDGAVAGDVLGYTGNYVRGGSVGGTENVTVVGRDEPEVGDRLLEGLQRFVSILVVGALLLWLAPRVVEGGAETLRRRPWASLGVGLLGMVGFVVLVLVIILAAVLLAIGLGLIRLEDLVGITFWGAGAVITALGFLFFLIAAFGAQAGVGLSLGRLAVGAGPIARRWAALILGVLVVVVISSLPVVGGWLGLVIAAFGLGALILEFWPWRRRAPQPVEGG
jgi:cytoskeletal protein CcmA (bactofilin family)